MRGSKVAIIDYMKQHNGITSMQAFADLGVTRLSARVKELRTLGYNIDTLMMEGITRYGEICKYAKYILKGEPNGN